MKEVNIKDISQGVEKVELVEEVKQLEKAMEKPKPKPKPKPEVTEAQKQERAERLKALRDKIVALKKEKMQEYGN